MRKIKLNLDFFLYIHQSSFVVNQANFEDTYPLQKKYLINFSVTDHSMCIVQQISDH